MTVEPLRDGIRPDNQGTWFKRYQAGGLDEMTVFDWKGRSGDLSRERMAELSARLGERLMRNSGEVAAYIAARWGVVYSHSGCVALLHRLGFEYKRPESLPARADEDCRITLVFLPAYAPHLNAIERLWAAMHREVTHNKFHASFSHFAEAIFDFFRRRMPQEWTKWRDTVTDKFTIISHKEFRVLE